MNNFIVPMNIMLYLIFKLWVHWRMQWILLNKINWNLVKRLSTKLYVKRWVQGGAGIVSIYLWMYDSIVGLSNVTGTFIIYRNNYWKQACCIWKHYFENGYLLLARPWIVILYLIQVREKKEKELSSYPISNVLFFSLLKL